MGFFIEKEREMGDPKLNPLTKTIFNLTASAALIFGVQKWSGENVEEGNEGLHQPGIFNNLRRLAGNLAYDSTLGLLMLSQSNSTSKPNEEPESVGRISPENSGM